MPAYSFKRKSVSYMTSEGIQHSKLVSMIKAHNRLYYQLENGDFVESTPLGFTKAYEDEELLKEFGKLYRGTTVR
jgi:hypothetical protein